MISPFRSQAIGLTIAIIAGAMVALTIWKALEYALDFWYLGEVIGLPLGIIFGRMVSFDLYAKQLREVPLNWIGVSLFLGKPTGAFYQNGTHWVFPFWYDILNVPGPTEKYILEMPGEKINSQDGITIYFGIPEERDGTRNRLQYSVVSPLPYIATDDPESSLQEAYVELARLFFGQAAKAIGIKNERSLFSEFITLPQQDDVDAGTRHTAFRTRLEEAKFVATSIQAEDILFSPKSVDVIMSKAGAFMEKCESWGIGNIISFTPNVRINPEAEAAAAQKQAAVELMVSLQTRADKIAELARQMTTAGVSPDLAMTLVAGLSGQKVNIDNKTINVAGLPETIKALVEMLTKIKTEEGRK